MNNYYLPFFLFVVSSLLCASSADKHTDFLQCLSKQFNNYSSISNIVYTPTNSCYWSVLQFSIRNLRFATNLTRKPQVIITPNYESEIPPVVSCAKRVYLQIRTRSGGHDYEGLSYVAPVPFVIIDMIKLSQIDVDPIEKVAWVGTGATLGSLYYRIAEKSSVLGFPSGVCPSVGAGGHISGGGWGMMLRKYGLAADQVIDARIVDANGRILDRKSMGEDMFWAIRGGGGSSFGVILAWKLQLVDVPKTVTTFTVRRTLEQNAIHLLHRWQFVAPNIDDDLTIMVMLRKARPGNAVNNTITASFLALFLGGVDRLLPLMEESFPELGLRREDCMEMSWIESAQYVGRQNGYPIQTLKDLLNRTDPNLGYVKIKSDYVQEPISEYALEGMLKLLYEIEFESQSGVFVVPYGGRMDEISESSIPFSHRAGYLYKLASIVIWSEEQAQNSERYIGWSRRHYNYLTPYVTKSPRAAYINYRDLDIGVNNNVGDTSYAQASIWGLKYFGNNFNRLVRVKSKVDPTNFFRNEQSIPSILTILRAES